MSAGTRRKTEWAGGFNSQIIRREKSEIVQIVRPTVLRLRKKSPHACSLALSFAFARRFVRRFRGVYTRAGSKRRFDVVNCEKGRHKVNTSASWLFRPRKKREGEREGPGMCARIANFIPTFFHCPAERDGKEGVGRRDARPVTLVRRRQ